MGSSIPWYESYSIQKRVDLACGCRRSRRYCCAHRSERSELCRIHAPCLRVSLRTFKFQRARNTRSSAAAQELVLASGKHSHFKFRRWSDAGNAASVFYRTDRILTLAGIPNRPLSLPAARVTSPSSLLPASSTCLDCLIGSPDLCWAYSIFHIPSE
jgi:hypothetical protein